MTATTNNYENKARVDAPQATSAPRYRTEARHRETKPFYRTSEFVVWLLATAGVLLATYVKYGRRLTAWHGWILVTVLAVAYVVTRGLAKAGSRDAWSASEGR